MNDFEDLVNQERDAVHDLRAHISYPRSCRGEYGRWDSHRPDVLKTLFSNDWTKKWYIELVTKCQLAALYTEARQRADSNHIPPPVTPLDSPIEMTDEAWEEIRRETERMKEVSEKKEADELEEWKRRDWQLYTHIDKRNELGIL